MQIRERVSEQTAWPGFELDDAANARDGTENIGAGARTDIRRGRPHG
jgi:hypothetical protein